MLRPNKEKKFSITVRSRPNHIHSAENEGIVVIEQFYHHNSLLLSVNY